MTASEAKNRIEELSQKIRYYNQQYYQNNQSEVPDFEFDRLLEELIRLEEEFPQWKSPSSPSQRVGGSISKEFPTVTHQYPMLSLGNTYSPEELQDFDKRVRKILEDEGLGEEALEYFCELKFDGVSLSVRYEKGALLQAVTRGDGVQGDEITANAKTILSLPLKLNSPSLPESFEIRGEVFMPNPVFEELNAQRKAEGKDLYANPRNTTSGTLKLQDSAEVARRKLDAYIYFLLGENLPFQSHSEAIHALEEWGFNVSPTYQKCSNLEEVFAYIHTWEEKRKTLPVETDGVVIKVNAYRQQEVLGFTSKSPRWAIAFKYQAEKASTRLQSISYQVGRTGALTPVAELKPVLLAGTTVKRASLHNANEMERLDLRLGDIVYVEKGGEIIPKVTGVNLSLRASDPPKIIFPSQCPECHTELIREEGEAQHFCPNQKNCPPQVKGRIQHFIQKKAMDIDSLGEGIIQQLYEQGLVLKPADLYELQYEQLINLERFAEKSAQNLLAGIEASKSRPFEKVLFALGIRFVGETVARKLVRHFQSLENMQKASLEELLEVEDIGERIAQSLIAFFQDESQMQMIDQLKAHGLHFEQEDQEENKLSNRLEGKTFVISGVFEQFSRNDLKASIENHGGKVVSSISKKLDYLVAGDKMGPSKQEKAEKLQVRILSEQEFIDLISDH